MTTPAEAEGTGTPEITEHIQAVTLAISDAGMLFVVDPLLNSIEA